MWSVVTLKTKSYTIQFFNSPIILLAPKKFEYRKKWNETVVSKLFSFTYESCFLYKKLLSLFLLFVIQDYPFTSDY